MANFRSILCSATLIIISVIVALCIAEIGLRLYGINSSSDRLHTYEFDENLGWRTRKNFKYYRSSLYYKHFNYYNPLGFPTDKENFNRTPDATIPSTVLIGDSFVEGYYVPYEQSFAYLLDQKLSNGQVINLGVSGYAPDQYLLSSREHLKNYNVENIVTTFFPYDDISSVFSDKFEGYAKPYFKQDQFDAPINLPLKKLKGNVDDKNMFIRLIRKTDLFTVLRPSLRKIISMIRPTSVAKAVVYEKSQMQKPLALINQIKKENANTNFLVYYIPSCEEFLDTLIYEHNINIYLELCGELNLQCAYLTVDISKYPDISVLYIPKDGHFTKLGSALVADQLYKLLSTN